MDATFTNQRRHSQFVGAGLIEVETNAVHVHAGKFNAIEEPLEVVHRSGVVFVKLNFGTHLATLAEFDRINIDTGDTDSGGVLYIYINIGCQSTGLRHFRGAVGRNGVSRHTITDAVLTIGNRIGHDGSNGICHCLTIHSPGVFDVLVVETVQLSVQHHRSTGADFNFRSIDLKVAAHLPNGELCGSTATMSRIHRHGIDTGNGGGQHISGVILGGVGVRTDPSVGSASHIRGHRHGGGGILTDHVVTRDDKSGCTNNCISDLSSNDRVVGTSYIGTFSGENIFTCTFQCIADGVEVFALNLDTVQIPVVSSAVVSVIINFEDCLAACADSSVFGRCKRDGRELLVKHIDDDVLLHLATGTGRSLDQIDLRNGGSVGYRSGVSGTMVVEVRSVSTIDLIPIIGDVLIVPTIEGGVESNRRTGAHIVFSSGNLEVGTDLLNQELSVGHAAGGGGRRQQVETGKRCINLIGTSHRRGLTGFRPLILSETFRSSQNI